MTVTPMKNNKKIVIIGISADRNQWINITSFFCYTSVHVYHYFQDRPSRHALVRPGLCRNSHLPLPQPSFLYVLHFILPDSCHFSDRNDRFSSSHEVRCPHSSGLSLYQSYLVKNSILGSDHLGQHKHSVGHHAPLLLTHLRRFHSLSIHINPSNPLKQLPMPIHSLCTLPLRWTIKNPRSIRFHGYVAPLRSQWFPDNFCMHQFQQIILSILYQH